MKKPKPNAPREASILHGLTVTKAHGTDARFTIPRANAAVVGRGNARPAWVACTCDLCRAVQRWTKPRAATARPRGA